MIFVRMRGRKPRIRTNGNVMQVGVPECLIILALVAIVTALAFRAGYFRGRNRP